jgi:filamentous hemagglutinin family protein
MQRQFMGLTLTGMMLLTTGATAIAQTAIVPDATLGNENSVLTTDAPDLNRITGGATRGSNLFHSFTGFAIGTNQTAWFDNALSIQHILVRVTGPTRSDIDGTLRANGNADLFLLNPNGFIFGPNARLDIGGAFSALTTTQIPLDETAVFSAIAPEQSQLLAIKPNVFFNLTPPQADIQLDGNLAVKTGQSITLWGDTVRLTGKLNAPSGRVRIFGDRVGLFDNAQINTSGETTGGQVLIGGEYQGKGVLPKAEAVYISPNAVVRSDALNNGDGGQIIAWSENSTKAYGMFSANGGSGSGNGGLIETSSRNFLDTTGIQIKATAPQGLPGTWLIDPVNVELNYDDTKLGAFDPTNIFTPTGTGATVNIPAIEKNLNDNINVTITTGVIGNQAGNITAKNFGINKTTPGNVTLTLQAANDIALTSFGINSEKQGNERQPLAIKLEAGRDINIGGGIQTFGAAFTAQAGREIKIKFGAVKSTDLGSGTGIPIRLAAPTVILDNAGIVTSTSNSTNGAPIVIQAANLNLNNAGLNTTTTGNGNAGDILIGGNIDARNQITRSSTAIELKSSGITSRTGVNVNNSGDVAKGSVNFDDNQADQFLDILAPNTQGKAGNIQIRSDRVALLGEAGITNSSFSQGNAGIIDIQSRDILIQKASGINGRAAVVGRGADIRLNTAGTLTILNSAGIASRSYGVTQDRPNQSTARSGDVTINAGRIKLDQGSGIDTNAGYSDLQQDRIFYPNTQGSAGDITVTADRFDAANGSGIRSETAGQGAAGTIDFTVRNDVTLVNNANISTGTFENSTGNGGRIIANVGNLLIGNNNAYKPDPNQSRKDPTKRAGGFSSASVGTGEAGNINLTVRDRLTIDNDLKNQGDNRAGIRLSSEQNGKGGTLTLAANQIVLNNAFISVKSARSTAGDIRLTVPSVILLRNGSEISATAGNRQNPGDGGNIVINTPLIVAIAKENSDITSDAFSGNGGLITINADNLIGLQFRPKATAFSDITASSERGNQGIVTLNTPEIDPSRGLTVLPIAPIDIAQKIDRRCNANDASSSSAFVVRGAGGLPMNPSQVIAPHGLMRLAQLRDDRQANERAFSPAIAAFPVEAQTAMRLADGRIQLRSRTLGTFAPSARSGCFHPPDRS